MSLMGGRRDHKLCIYLQVWSILTGIYRRKIQKKGEKEIPNMRKGIRQLSYDRAEMTLSDHRPVSSMFVVELIFDVKLQKSPRQGTAAENCSRIEVMFSIGRDVDFTVRSLVLLSENHADHVHFRVGALVYF
ncbi:hypothetical protein Leryth_022535 [Lithospermum erythrorhizon]|nr:hypothetical protein Leryth_022535 [Lithospermum erythrorhizon]